MFGGVDPVPTNSLNLDIVILYIVVIFLVICLFKSLLKMEGYRGSMINVPAYLKSARSTRSASRRVSPSRAYTQLQGDSSLIRLPSNPYRPLPFNPYR